MFGRRRTFKYPIHLHVKKLSPDAILPTRGSKHAAGYDLYSIEEVTIKPGEVVKVHTGIATEFSPMYFAGVYSRSGIATKYGIGIANYVAVIDADYRGEWVIPLRNAGNEPYTIYRGGRCAHAIFQPYTVADIVEVDELEEPERSTGV